MDHNSQRSNVAPATTIIKTTPTIPTATNNYALHNNQNDSVKTAANTIIAHSKSTSSAELTEESHGNKVSNAPLSALNGSSTNSTANFLSSASSATSRELMTDLRRRSSEGEAQMPQTLQFRPNEQDARVIIDGGDQKENEHSKHSSAQTYSGRNDSSGNGRSNRVPKTMAYDEDSKQSLPKYGLYTDHSQVTFSHLSNTERSNLHLYNTNTIGGPFPIKLQIVLKVIEQLGKTNVISWLPHGRAFIINRPREFENDIMNRFFKQTKLSSFKRQLNLYDFQRITQGPDSGSYYHEMFLRGKPMIAMKMIRRKIKGNDRIPHGNIDDEPNFYAMPMLGPTVSNGNRTRNSQDHIVPRPSLDEYNDPSRRAPPIQSDLDIVSLRRQGIPNHVQQRIAHDDQLMASSILQLQNQNFPDTRSSYLMSDPMSSLHSMSARLPLGQQLHLPRSEGPYSDLTFGAGRSNNTGLANLPHRGMYGGLPSLATASSITASSDASLGSLHPNARYLSLNQNNLMAHHHQRRLLLENQLLENMRINSLLSPSGLSQRTGESNVALCDNPRSGSNGLVYDVQGSISDGRKGNTHK